MASRSTCSRCVKLLASTKTPATRSAACRRTIITSASTQYSKTLKTSPSSQKQSISTAPEVPDSAWRAIASAGARDNAVPKSAPGAPATAMETINNSFINPSFSAAKQGLFHSFTNSPSPWIRRRAAVMRQNAYCPHPDHQATRVALSPNDLESRKTGNKPPAHVRYECPDCGIPVSCSEEHFVDDYEQHLELCDVLRQVNEDEHDLLSGRHFGEFTMPGMGLEEQQINLLNWDTLLYTREFEAIDDARPMRQATRMLTYPMTIGSVIHELSPYDLKKGNRLTPEGLRSFSALRYTLHPPADGADRGISIKGLRPKAPLVRIFILGARAESSLPGDVWSQLIYLFDRAQFHLIFIGPEAMTNRDDEFPLPERTPRNPFGAVVEDRLGGMFKISTIVDYYHTLHKSQYFYPYDPYFDCFVLFHPGLGHPSSSHEWADTLPMLLETKVPIICTGYTQVDMERDIKWVKEQAADEMDILLEPGENRFRSLRWDLNDMDPSDLSCGNWGVWAFRGKRYETDKYSQKSTEA